jgi:hypothetical protein
MFCRAWALSLVLTSGARPFEWMQKRSGPFRARIREGRAGGDKAQLTDAASVCHLALPDRMQAV